MAFLGKLKRLARPDPGTSKRGPALTTSEASVGCDIVHEGERPLKAEYVLSFYDRRISTDRW